MKTQQTKLKRMTAEELASRPPMYKTTADGRTQYLSPSERREQDKAQPDTARHSPLPWHIAYDGRDYHSGKVPIAIISRPETCVQVVANLPIDSESDANARLIVHAVNNADKLAEALRGVQWKITAYGTHWEPSQAEREAIAKALADWERSAQ